MTAKTQARIHIRWMIQRDLPECLDIEKQSFEFPWSNDDLRIAQGAIEIIEFCRF